MGTCKILDCKTEEFTQVFQTPLTRDVVDEINIFSDLSYFQLPLIVLADSSCQILTLVLLLPGPAPAYSF